MIAKNILKSCISSSAMPIRQASKNGPNYTLIMIDGDFHNASSKSLLFFHNLYIPEVICV